MREIKFRAWDKVNSNMIYSPIWISDTYGERSGVIGLDGSIGLIFKSSRGLEIKEVKNQFILQQFTGLKDKNGEEIYSGDLFMDEEDGTYNWVEWNDVYGGWGTNQWFLPKELVEQAPTLEIVGNIYEDSHLLNSSEVDII